MNPVVLVLPRSRFRDYESSVYRMVGYWLCQIDDAWNRDSYPVHRSKDIPLLFYFSVWYYELCDLIKMNYELFDVMNSYRWKLDRIVFRACRSNSIITIVSRIQWNFPAAACTSYWGSTVIRKYESADIYLAFSPRLMSSNIIKGPFCNGSRNFKAPNSITWAIFINHY